MEYGNRIPEKEYTQSKYWADSVADYLIKRHPKRKHFICSPGLSPSGSIHFGNFREVATNFAVAESLKSKGKSAEIVLFWDNYDRFRKVPAGIDESYKEHIGKPYTSIPAPKGNLSFAEYFQEEFKKSMEMFNINITYKDQTEIYKAGGYDKDIIEAMQKRKEIAKILLSFMTEKGKELKGVSDERYIENYYPISVYSSFTQKDATTILSYDGQSTIKYRCEITKKEEEIDFTKTRIVKLNWKIDWAMRWKHYSVCFEPGGSDHIAPEGSYNSSSVIVEKIFNGSPPDFVPFGFVGISGLGTKMSGSSGENITPQTLLNIYEPSLLLFMYLRRIPSQTFSLSFGNEVYRQYDEIDRAITKSKENFFKKLFLKGQEKTQNRLIEILKNTYPKDICKNKIPFRQLVGLAQTVQWNEEKLYELIKSSGQSFDKNSIKSRLERAKTWLSKYNRDAIFSIREKQDKEVWSLIDEKNQKYIKELSEYIEKKEKINIKDLETFIYSLPSKDLKDKELKKAQRELFKNIYMLLINKDTGPRISTLIWSIEKEKIISLLKK